MTATNHRVLMNLLYLAGTAYWIVLLDRLVYDNVAVVDANLRFIGVLLLFAGAIMVIMSLIVYDDKHVKTPSVFEVVYWVVNSITFLVLFLIAIGS